MSLHYEDAGLRLWHGSNMDVLPTFPDGTFDSIVTDPPYELSNDGKASPGRVLAEFMFPEQPKIIPEAAGDDELPFLVSKVLGLGGVGRIPTPSATMPVGSVALDDHATIRDHNVEDGEEGAVNVADDHALINEEPETAEHLGCFQFKLADSAKLLQILGEVGCGFQSGGLGIGLRVSSPGLPGLLASCAAVVSGGHDVRLCDDALARLVRAFSTAGERPVLSLGDLSGASGEVFTTDGAFVFLGLSQLAGAHLVRTSTAARGLSSKLQACRIRVVDDVTNRALTFDLLVHPTSISSVGFMGKEWDGSKIAYDVDLWAECLRVLKPGGFLLAFGGTRTWHRVAVAVEDAGFEVRDSIAWLYGSGFPKSLDVSKQIEKLERGEVVRAKLLHFAAERGVDGKWLETNGVASASSFTDWTVGGHVPSDKNWQIVKGLLAVTRAEEAAFERDVIAEGRSRVDDGTVYALGHSGRRVGAAVTDAAREWEGWGTALKPAFEPVVVARKPLIGTVARNVLAYGTGALNIDATRVGDELLPAQTRGVTKMGTFQGADGNSTPERSGRWPTNVVLDESYEPVLQLRDNLSPEVERVIRESLNASVDHLPAVRRHDERATEPSGPHEVLLNRVLRPMDGIEPRGGEGPSLGEAPHAGDASTDIRHEAGESSDRGARAELEGRPSPEQWVRDTALLDTDAGRAADVRTDAGSQRERAGAQGSGGAVARSAVDAGRSGASSQRLEVGQPDRESGIARVEQFASDEALGRGRRASTVASGERSTAPAPLTVLRREIPSRWLGYFVDTGRTVRESQAAALDAQTGVSTSPSGIVVQGGRHGFGPGGPHGAERNGQGVGYGDSGGASRFFPTFRYEAKAPSTERPEVDGTQHATVKPLNLMRWLVRLTTRPGGRILDPFAGSGTTGEAALLEGMEVDLIELEADHLPLILQRVRKPLQPSMFGDWDEATA